MTRYFLQFRSGYKAQFPDLAHLIHVYAKIRTRAHQTICIRRREAEFCDQPIHEMKRRRLDRDFQRARRIYRDEGVRLLDSHPGDLFRFDDVELDLDRRFRLGGSASEFRVPLACVDIAEVKEGARMMDRQVDAIADGDIANIEVAAPFPLAVEAGGDFPVGSDADRAVKRLDRPGDFAGKVEGAVARRAARAGGVLKDLRGILVR